MPDSQAKCLYCQRSSEQVPLIALQFRDTEAWICPQHLPILIHKPNQLAGHLPGAENLAAAEGHEH